MDLFCISPSKRDYTFLPFIWKGKKIMYIMLILSNVFGFRRKR